MIKIFRRREQGQTIAEFALVLPVLAMLLFGIVQFGVVFNQYLAVTDAVRAGAREGAVARMFPPNEREQRIKDAVYEAAPDLRQEDGFQAFVDPPAVWEPGADVTVSAEYPYSIDILGLVVKEGFVTSKTTERVE